MKITDRFKDAWNAFNNRSPTPTVTSAPSYFGGRSRAYHQMRYGAEKTIITSVYTRIANDVAKLNFRHVLIDKNDKYLDDVPKSSLNERFKLRANIDQLGVDFFRDVVMSLFDEGVVAIVPVDTSTNITKDSEEAFRIDSLRCGKVIEWYSRHVKIDLYNDRTGNHEWVILPKESVAIITNPFYSVMNEPNSTAQRLIRKLSLLDSIDEQSASGKLDIIIQLPYSVKTDLQRSRAATRKKDIEDQLQGSKYGIAYIDATEKVTQLNRPAENNMLNQIEFLTNNLLSQLGVTTKILDGTASEEEILNYYNNTIEPVADVIALSIKCAFLSKTAITQGQSIMYFRDPFKLVPLAKLAEIADSFTRNEIMSSNEMRATMQMKPSDDPNADLLLNKNLNQGDRLTTTGEEYLDEEPLDEDEVY